MAKRRIKPAQPLPADARDARPTERIHLPVSVSFRYAETKGRYSLVKAETREWRDVIDCLRQLTTMTWRQVQTTGGKGGQKQGLGYTPYKDSDLKGVNRPQRLSPDLGIFSVRASRATRLFLAYDDHITYLLWFDRRHRIAPDPAKPN